MLGPRGICAEVMSVPLWSWLGGEEWRPAITMWSRKTDRQTGSTYIVLYHTEQHWID